MRVVNLSNHPFVNERPVRRVTATLWLVAVVLIAFNIFNYWTYWLDSAEIRGDLGELRESVEKSTKDYGNLRQEVANVKLSALNNKTVFLNELIEFRTFPWSQLFDDLEHVLEPHYEIQLRSVQPQQKKEKTKRPTKTSTRQRDQKRGQKRDQEIKPPLAQSKRVGLQLKGVSRSSEAIYGLVDGLFAHSAFLEPNLRGESKDDNTKLTSFDIGVVYLTHTSENTSVGQDPDQSARNANEQDQGKDEDEDLQNPDQATARPSMSQPDSTRSQSDGAGSQLDGTRPQPEASTVSNLQQATTKAAPPRQVSPPRQGKPSRQVPPPRQVKPPRQGKPSRQVTSTPAATPGVPLIQGKTTQRNTAQRNTAQRSAQPLRPRQVPPPPFKNEPARSGTTQAKPIKAEPLNEQPPPSQPNFDSEVASDTPRLKGGA